MYRIVIQPIAINLLREISDRIDKLKESSEMQGKPLLGELDGYYSVRAVGQRYRIIYVIEQAQVTVMIVALGIRKDGSKQDVYALAKKLLRLGLLDESEADRDDD
ncbi:MAG: type II toxin-antitoxin system RelE family toxin [Pseudanabaena sp.]